MNEAEKPLFYLNLLRDILGCVCRKKEKSE